MAKDEIQVALHMPKGKNGVTAQTPNEWFADKFPVVDELYGSAFLETAYTAQNGLDYCVPLHLNHDFFAAILGGDKRLAHDVVYYPEENQFYFYDPVPDAYCPTSEDKLKLLVSNYLTRCATECGNLVDVGPLMIKFKHTDTLKSIISTAKALLGAEKSYFRGDNGKRRYIDGKYLEPNALPSYAQFVKTQIIPVPQAKMPLATAFNRYFNFCKEIQIPPLTRQEFKQLVAEVIRSEFNLGLRHDVPSENGKEGHGWFGLSLRGDSAPVLHGAN